MKRHLLFFFPIAYCNLIGCAQLPQLPSAEGISVSDIVDAVQCELASVYTTKAHLLRPKYADALDAYTAGVELDLKVNEQTTANASVAWTVPVVGGSTLKFNGLGAGPFADDTAFRFTTLKFTVNMADLRALATSKRSSWHREVCEHQRTTGLPPVYNTLGLDDWLIENINALGLQDAAEVDSLAYLLQFILIRGANGGIAFQTINLDAGLGGTAKRTRDNTLNLVLTQTPTKPKPKEIIIVGYHPGQAPLTKNMLAPTAATRNRGLGSTTAPRSSQEVRQRLDYLLQQQRYNSIISPNRVFVPGP